MSQNSSKIKAPFFFFYAKDWREGVQHLDADERGVYIDLIAAMWNRKGGVPDDPKWIAKDIGLDTRLVKRVVTSLVAKGKLRRVDGFLQNKKIMEEISRYLRRGGHEIEVENAVQADECDMHCDVANEELSDSYPLANADLEKMPLFSLGNPALEVRSQNTEDRKKEDGPPASTVEQDPAGGRAGASPEFVILKSIADWTADEARARSWVTAHVGLYGLEVVRDAVAVVVAEIAAGRHVAQPVQLVSSVIRRLDAKKPGPEERAHREAGTVPPWVADKSVRGRKIADVMAEFYADKARRMAEDAAA